MDKKTVVFFFITIFTLSIFVNIFNVKSETIIDVHYRNLSNNLLGASRRTCIDSNGYIYAIYVGLNETLFSEKSTDGGLTWGTKRWIPEPSSGDLDQDFDIVVDGNDKLWVVYLWYVSYHWNIRVVNSTDGAETWSDDFALTNPYDDSITFNMMRRTSITVDNDNDITIASVGDTKQGHVCENIIHHFNSNSEEWDELIVYEGDSNIDRHDIDCAVFSNDTVVVCYSKDIDDAQPEAEFYYFYYYPSTNTNSTIYALYNDTTTNCAWSDVLGLTCISDNNNIVHFAYARDNGTKQGIFYKNLTNGVLSSEEEIISDAIRDYKYPSISWTANGDVDVLFNGGNSCGANGSVLYSEKPLGGTWSNVTYTVFSGGSIPKIIYNRYPDNALLLDGFRFVYYQRNDTTNYYNFTYADCSMFYWCDINCTAPECFNYNLTPIPTNITINVYNESNPAEGLSFDVFITNQSGTDTYYSTSCSNPTVISMSDSPTGDRTSFTVHSDGYYPRTFIMDIDPSTNYILNVYLAPKTANIYCLIVINEYNNPVDDVKMVIQRYMNTTDGYENMSILYTDGAGQILVYLIPDTSYKITLSKTGYKTKIENYIPDPLYYGLGYPKYFKIYFVDHNYTNGTIYWEVVNFSCNMSNNHLYINYLDIMNQTLNTSIIVYEVNTSTGNISVFGYSNHTTNNSFQTIFNDVNMSNCYKVVLNLNHSLFGFFHDLRVVCDINTTTSQGFFDNIFNLNYGSSPGGFGWSNIFGFIILVSGMFAFGQQGSGVAMIVTGGLLAFINSYIGLTVISVIATSILIVFGILIVWQNQRRTLG